MQEEKFSSGHAFQMIHLSKDGGQAMIDILIGVLEQGFIYGIMALGVYITYKILDFPDLSVDGTFPLGAAVTAILLTKGVNPWLAIGAAIICGALAGLFTGIVHVKFHVQDLLSGIITMTALYTVNLRIAGRANLPIFNEKTIFNSGLAEILPRAYRVVIMTFLLVLVMKLLMDWYLKTRSGFLLFATGDNKTLVTSLGKDQGKVKIMGLVLANALVAMSGSVMCQQQRFFEVSMGTGAIMIGLASVIIGINLFKNVTFIKATAAVIIGAIIYKGCIALAIALGLQATDMKLITALLFLLVLTINGRKKGESHA